MTNKDIGQCLMIGLSGEELLQEEKNLIEKFDIGSVILFKRNCLNYKKLKNLCKALHQLKTTSPLIIAIDREGIPIDRLSSIPEMVSWPHPAKLVQKMSLKDLGEMYFFLNQELKHLGINMNLSPCLDLTHSFSLVLKNRTLSKNPITVGQVGKILIQKTRQARILSCAKHFPGHGGVVEDSHFMKPIDPSQNISFSILPFRFAQSQHVPSIMLSHILYPYLDSKYPASISKKIIQHLLKDKLQFKGLILTDDIDMLALKEYPPHQVAEKTLVAGAHILICGNNPKTVHQILNFIPKNLEPLIHLRKQEILKFKKRHLHELTPTWPPLHPLRSVWKQKIQNFG